MDLASLYYWMWIILSILNNLSCIFIEKIIGKSSCLWEQTLLCDVRVQMSRPIEWPIKNGVSFPNATLTDFDWLFAAASILRFSISIFICNTFNIRLRWFSRDSQRKYKFRTRFKKLIMIWQDSICLLKIPQNLKYKISEN